MRSSENIVTEYHQRRLEKSSQKIIIENIIKVIMENIIDNKTEDITEVSEKTIEKVELVGMILSFASVVQLVFSGSNFGTNR